MDKSQLSLVGEEHKQRQWKNHHRRTTTFLIGITSLLIFYSVFSKTNSLKDIRNLTIEIESKVDSLRSIQSRYDSLEIVYREIAA